MRTASSSSYVLQVEETFDVVQTPFSRFWANLLHRDAIAGAWKVIAGNENGADFITEFLIESSARTETTRQRNLHMFSKIFARRSFLILRRSVLLWLWY